MKVENIMNVFNTYTDLIGRTVEIKTSSKTAYLPLIHRQGVVSRVSGSSIGVRIDGMRNPVSEYGVYWFNRNEIKVLNTEGDIMNMVDFKHVAMVKLLDDYSKKAYAFAIYEEELKALGDNYKDVLVVVNARGKNNRVLGNVSNIYTVEEFFASKDGKNINITAEVVGVVDMTGYTAREEEKNRQKELAKKKAAIEKELEAEINKRKSIEYYEAMAKEYADNPKLAELVAELKQLGA